MQFGTGLDQLWYNGNEHAPGKFTKTFRKQVLTFDVTKDAVTVVEYCEAHRTYRLPSTYIGLLDEGHCGIPNKYNGEPVGSIVYLYPLFASYPTYVPVENEFSAGIGDGQFPVAEFNIVYVVGAY